MSVYTPPALNAVDFALTAHTVPSIASPTQALSPYSVPTLTAVNFSLIAYTQPTYQNIGWELLPSVGAITGTLAATDGPDTAAFTGKLGHVGTLAATDGADTAAFSGKLGHVGALSATDGADTCVATGTVSGSVEGVYPGSGHPAGGSRISPHGLLKKRAKPFDADLAEQMREAYNEILGIAKPQVKKQAAKIVRPFIEHGVKPITIPPASIIDWKAMERDAARVSALLELWQSEMQAMEDEEILLLLMAA